MADREKPTAGRDEIMTSLKTSKAAHEKPEEGSRDAIEKPEFICTIKEIGQMEEPQKKMAEVLKEMKTNLKEDPLLSKKTPTETAAKKSQPYFQVKDIPREEMLKKIDEFTNRLNSDVKVVVEVPKLDNNMIFSHNLRRWILGTDIINLTYYRDKQEIDEKKMAEIACLELICDALESNRGRPTSVATRLFVRRMRYELRLPTFALMDCDAFGIRIFSTDKYGLKSLSFDSGRVTIRDIKLLGLLPSQIDACGILEGAKLKMGENDIQNIKQLLKFLTVAMKFIVKHGKSEKDIHNLRQEIEVTSAVCSIGS
ncbi:hypothetical protein RHSIM_Rhsim03G0164900 [Rhododendron simsii]|uniref:Topoisomerase 6 subunit A/Spo11 TOPRIM domain-containing protein n=1 Tax=Rhododendron simsii TaxID=118357 RepID=A0A834LT27_RHOSS|nr:hypothetical protein RHSIM_Rhsim03G0164900 [Rhododendron simsii]